MKYFAPLCFFSSLCLALLAACGGSTDAQEPQSTADAGTAGAGGSATCAEGSTKCHGVCTDLKKNQAHCGECDAPCAPMQRCKAGSCTWGGCMPELVVCDGFCQTFESPDNCGGCGEKCADQQVCSLSVCSSTCATGFTNCNNRCADLESDAYNCGACGNDCTKQAPGNLGCVKGHCTSDCPSGWEWCLEACRSFSTDPHNCGLCGNACAPGESCLEGICRTVMP